MAEREKIGIVTDSGSMIKPEEAEKLGIDVGPIRVRFGDEEFTDHNITAREVKKKFEKTGIHPTTSGVTVGDLVNAYKRQLDSSGKIVSIHIPKNFSRATHEAAENAARIVQQELELPKSPVKIFDSGQIGPAARFLVLETINILRIGERLHTTLPYIQELRSRLVTIGTFESLHWVAKTGRFNPKLLDFFQRAMDTTNRAPVVYIRNGEVIGPNPIDPRNWKKLPSKENVMRRIARLALAEDIEQIVGIFHFVAEEKANELNYLMKQATGTGQGIFEPPASFAAGAGPGFVGICILEK